MDYQSSTKDRTLGWQFIQVSDLAQSGHDKNIAPWVAKEPVDTSGMFSTNHGRDIKGTLFYEAKFLPCAPMPGLAFDPPESSAQSQSRPQSITSIASDTHEQDVVDHRMERDLERVRTQNRERSNTETTQPDSVPEIRTSVDSASAGATANGPKGPPTIPREDLLRTGAHVAVFLSDQSWHVY